MSQQINLFNPVFLAQKKYFSAVAMLQALALVLGGMLLMEVFAVHQAGQLERQLASTVRDAEQQRERVVAIGKQFSGQGVSKSLEEEVARSEDTLRRRRDLVSEITTNVGGNTAGFSVYLTALARQTAQGVWLTGIEVSGRSNDIVIRGRALNPDMVPSYVRSLSREPAFAGRALSSLQVTARQEPAPGGNPAAAPGIRGPSRYLEFTLNIPLGDPGGSSSPQKGSS
jgi:hypothetical protein